MCCGAQTGMTTLYEHMPEDMRQAVDDIVEVLGPEPWPDRFAALYVLLTDKLDEGTAGVGLASWYVFRERRAWCESTAANGDGQRNGD